MKFRLANYLFGKRKEEPKSEVHIQLVPTTIVTMKMGAYYRLQDCTMDEQADRYVVTYPGSPVKHTLYKHDISVISEGLLQPKIAKDKP